VATFADLANALATGVRIIHNLTAAVILHHDDEHMAEMGNLPLNPSVVCRHRAQKQHK
jgi:hypothetical protein